jgi:fermentation-respiration switch protein FrsA (DUF1100 family)
VVLYLHGNSGNLSDYAPMLEYFQKQLRVTTLIFDYRGFGRSEGVPIVPGVVQDCRAARKFLAQRVGVREADIVLVGRSLGGALAVQLAGDSPARALILESTFSSLRDEAAHLAPYLAWVVPASELDSVSQIARYNGPLLQSHGDADRTIPYALGQKLFRAAREPKRFITISGADHNDGLPASYYQELDSLIDRLPGR